jgi:hypothetical protein
MRRLTAAAAAAAALLLAACSPDTADYKEEAEKYIESRGFAEEAQLLRFTDVECEEPESTDEDERYTCTATSSDGVRWEFDVDIVGDADLEVILPPRRLSAAPTASSTPADSAPATTVAGSTTSTTSTASTTATTTATTVAATTTTTAT